MTSEWDNTPWSGTVASAVQPSSGRKAVSGPGVLAYYNDLPLNSWLYGDAQSRMAAFLRAYKVGWFYKAGRKISESVSTLIWTISDGDAESNRSETVLPTPDLDVPFDELGPIDQLMRLLEQPNPYQTGRMLFAKTQIRRDFAGTTMWYLEGGENGQLPTAIYGVSPARMWPSRGPDGRLIGWVLDKNGPSGGVPFTADEIVSFPMASADDDDEAGVGVVESVFSELPLADLFARHTGDLLTTGGRLAGMLSPKNRTLTPDEFDDAVKAWRSVASDPNAAKRLLLFPEPMEYSKGASTPSEIGIPELAGLNRDNILTAFPIDPTMLGAQMPSGLNANGSTRREIKQEYWEGTIGTRTDGLKEVIQGKLVSRYERIMGQTFDFDFNIPNLDDAPSIIEKVGALKGLVSVGFDPKEAVKAVALDHVKWIGLPEMLDPAKQAQMQRDAQAAAAAAKPPEGVVATADGGVGGDNSLTHVPVAKADKSTDHLVKRGETAVRTFLSDQRDRLGSRIRDLLPQTKAARKALPDDWWDQAGEDAALREALHTLYLEIGQASLQTVSNQLGRVQVKSQVNRVLSDLLDYGGARITDINERTRDAVKAQLVEGVRRGYSINQLVEGVADENYAGVQSALLDNGVPAFDPYRAELISRTETMLSANRAAITGYGTFGVREVQAIDGDGDEQCASRNGRTFSIEDALGIQDHPNGTLDWIPVLDKAAHEPINVSPVTNVHISLPETKIANSLPAPVVNVTNDVPAPTVNVTNEVVSPQVNVTNDVQTPDVRVVNEVVTPEVHVTVPTPLVTVNNDVRTPSVHVEAPVVNVTNDVKTPEVTVTNEVVTPEVHVTVPDVTVNVPRQAVTKSIKRDRHGRITDIVES